MLLLISRARRTLPVFLSLAVACAAAPDEATGKASIAALMKIHPIIAVWLRSSGNGDRGAPTAPCWEQVFEQHPQMTHFVFVYRDDQDASVGIAKLSRQPQPTIHEREPF